MLPKIKPRRGHAVLPQRPGEALQAEGKVSVPEAAEAAVCDVTERLAIYTVTSHSLEPGLE